MAFVADMAIRGGRWWLLKVTIIGIVRSAVESVTLHLVQNVLHGRLYKFTPTFYSVETLDGYPSKLISKDIRPPAI